jgi:hypothetical protein
MVNRNIVAESSQDQSRCGKTEGFHAIACGDVGIDPRREGYQVEWLKITPSMLFLYAID